jgi:hypothetical protein
MRAMKKRKKTLALSLMVSVIIVNVGSASEVSAQPQPTSEVDTCANAAEESQALRKDGKLTQAKEKLIICARSSCPAFIQKDCANWLSEVDKTMPSIVLRALDSKGRDVSAVKVLIDGKVLADKLDGRPLSVDPGEHVMTYEMAGEKPVKETILIRQGEANRLVSVTFQRPGDRRATEGGESQQPSSSSSAIPLSSWVLGGAGIVLGGVGAALWFSGKGDHSDMESGCAKTRSCRQDDVDEAKTKLLLGDVAIGAGIVALGVAVVLVVMSKSTKSTPPPIGTALIRY